MVTNLLHLLGSRDETLPTHLRFSLANSLGKGHLSRDQIKLAELREAGDKATILSVIRLIALSKVGQVDDKQTKAV